MRAKSEKRLQAEKLRYENGLSYNEIAALIGVSKSTLSSWLKNIPLTPEQGERIQQRLENNQTTFVKRAWKINKERFQKARQDAFHIGVNVISHLSVEDPVDELALAMLYLGEGDKSGNRLMLASTDPLILRYFLWAIWKLYGIEREDVTFRLNLVEAARLVETSMIAWWAEQLSTSPEQFRKTQFDDRSKYSEIRGDYHGVCTITYNDTYLFHRLVGVYSTYVQSRIGTKNDRS
jgi:transcriptional regulator with XRE-family HTH domain